MTHLLANRHVSSFPLSIGTAMAFERLLEPTQPRYDPDRPVLPKLPLPDALWINAETLLRNIAGAVTKEDMLLAHPSEFYDTLLFECELIISLLRIEGKNRCQPHFYCSDYAAVYGRPPPPGISVRQQVTAAQKRATVHLDKVRAHLRADRPFELTVWANTVVPEKPMTAYMLTHVVYDLFAWPAFKHLTLLESHTGADKPRTLWYTKYMPVPNQSLRTLPLDPVLLPLFGDRVLYAPVPVRLRERILEIAAVRQWTPLTTKEKVRFYLERDLTEPEDRQLIRSLA